MKVKELIEVLKYYPEDAEVEIWTYLKDFKEEAYFPLTKKEIGCLKDDGITTIFLG